MRKIATNDALMTTREAGATLGVAVRTVQLWVESGVLPAWRTAGGHRRIARSAVDKLMQERALVLAPGQASDIETGAQTQPTKILVVEDDPTLLNLFSMVIDGWKFPLELTLAVNGFDGLLCIGKRTPDVIITDLNMPGMDGFEMLRALKKPGSGFSALKVIVVSALGLDDIKDRGGLPEDVTFFQKPVDFSKLEQLVTALHSQRVGKGPDKL
jgi:excisionase family DNA binding protein